MDAKARLEVFAHKSVKQVADHFADLIAQVTDKPAVIGHSFGGLITQIIAGRGLAAASVAIDPAPFRGVLPLPISSLKSASPVLGKPANRKRGPAHLRAVPLRARQAASANLNPWTEAEVDTKNPERGPLLITDGEKDNTVPWSIANASFKRQQRNEGVTEKSSRSQTAVTHSRSTAAGAKSPTPP